MSVKFRIVHELDERKWIEFVSNHPDGNIFHTPDFYHIFQLAKNHKTELWFCLNSDNRILAFFMPVYISFISLFKTKTTRAISYGSILAENSDLGTSGLNYLLETYNAQNKNKILLTEIRNSSDMVHFKSTFIDNNYQYHDYLNYMIDLQRSPQQIFEKLSKNARKRIRHAFKINSVQIHECNCQEQLEKAYILLKQTYRYKRVPLADFSLFQNAFNILFPKNAIKILLASINNQFVATSIELYYKDVVYGWYGGLNRKYGKYNVNEILTWYILRTNAENGYKTYDFGGAGYPNEAYGVRDFKAKFGGTLVNFGRFTHIHSPVWCNLSKIVYTLFQKLPRIKSN